MKERPQLSIVLASRNNWNYIDGCLSSIPAGGISNHEIIVVDNASTDGTADSIASAYPEIRLIRNESNQGHCRGMNQGIRAAVGEYVLAVDGDTVIRPGACAALVRFLDVHPEAAIVAPKMLNGDGTLQETARSFPTVMNGLFGRQSILTRLFPQNRFSRTYLRRDGVDATEPFQVDWVSAAAMAFRRTLPDLVGYWDESIRGYWVDADWCKTAHKAGRIYCVPAAEVTHFEQNRAGKKKTSSRIILFHTGAFRFYKKHFTHGLWDPRTLLAGTALFTRAALMVLVDAFRSPETGAASARDPRSLANAGMKNALRVQQTVDLRSDE
jgi:GT2 family glycosyltransferase